MNHRISIFTQGTDAKIKIYQVATDQDASRYNHDTLKVAHWSSHSSKSNPFTPAMRTPPPARGFSHMQQQG